MPNKIPRKMPFEMQKKAMIRLLKKAIREGKLPESLDISEVLDHMDPTLRFDENISIIEEYLGVKLRKEKLPKRAEKHLERMEEEEAKAWERVSQFCEKYPTICENYPVVIELIRDGYISPKEMEKLWLAHPEWIKELDGLSPQEAIERLREEEREIKRFIKEFNPPRDIKAMLKDPTLPMEVKKKIMSDYRTMLEFEKKPIIKAPPRRVRAIPKKKKFVIPEAPPMKIEVKGEKIEIKEERKEEIYYSRESEKDMARRLLREQYGIEPKEIIYIIKSPSGKFWTIVGVDQYGNGFKRDVWLQEA